MKLKFLAILFLSFSLISSAFAESYSCPDPSKIWAGHNDFPVVVWIGPAVPSATGWGVGIGGSKVGAFIRAESATVDGYKGWMCEYQASDRPSIAEMYKNQDKIPEPLRGLIDELAAQGTYVGGVVAYISQHQ